MGVGVSVFELADLMVNDTEGAKWFRESLAKVNEVLAENGLPLHVEPEKLPPMRRRSACNYFPYSYIHHLRRAYAHIINKPNWTATPMPEGEDPTKDPVLDKELYVGLSHLLCHSDCEGIYLPIEFDEPIVDDKKLNRIPGGLMGSSYRLLDELNVIAPKLGIRLEGGHLSDSEADKINHESDSQKGLYIEKIVWISLFEAARLSIEYKTAIYFS
jgi:hypothetical protein